MKIFIIEDEPAIREELVQLLQKYGYQCDSSDDFHHIVQAALSSGANLILLDINLPYQDGFQVCRLLHQCSCRGSPEFPVHFPGCFQKAQSGI